MGIESLPVLAASSAALQLANAMATIQSSAVAIAKLQTPNAPQGINGFVFDIPLEETLTYSSSITDHFTQTNVSIQDHIALNPVKITLVGNVGELIWKKSLLEIYAEQIINSMGLVFGLLPRLGQNTIEFLAGYEELNRQVEEAKKVYNNFNSIFKDPKPTNQQTQFNVLRDMFLTRTLATVQTPWGTFTNMAIENLEWHQDADTKDLSTVTVVFKQIQTTNVNVTKPRKKGRAASQQADQVKKGQVQGKPVGLQNFLSSLTTISSNITFSGVLP